LIQALESGNNTRALKQLEIAEEQLAAMTGITVDEEDADEVG
jgi:hypothetical protein